MTGIIAWAWRVLPGLSYNPDIAAGAETSADAAKRAAERYMIHPRAAIAVVFAVTPSHDRYVRASGHVTGLRTVSGGIRWYGEHASA